MPNIPSELAGSETILMAEDDAGMRTILRQMLGAAGYTVLEASSGEDAWTIAADHPGQIDLLITDVRLPGMDGAELAERLTRARLDLKVLLASGYSDLLSREAGARLGAVRFIQKPFSPFAFLKVVRAVLDQSNV